MKTTLVLAAALSAGIAFAQQGGQDAFLKQQAYAEMQRVSGQVDVLQNNFDDLQRRVVNIERGNNTQDLRQEIEALKASVEYDGADGVLDLTVSGVDNYATKTKNSLVTDSEADDPAYKKTAYTISDGSVVLVTYTNGTDTVRFLLNFSIFTVNVRYNGQIYTLGKYDFVRLDPRADGTTDPRTR